MAEDIDSAFEQLHQSKWMQLRNATRLAFEHRKRVAAGDLSVCILPLALAMAKDGLLDFIPFIGLFFGVFITTYLFIFMWGRGRWILRILFFFVATVGNLPFIKLLPFDTISVLFAYFLARKDVAKAKEKLEKVNQVIPRLADDLRGVARQRARAQEAAQEAEASAAQSAAQMDTASRSPERLVGAAPVLAVPRGQVIPSRSDQATALRHSQSAVNEATLRIQAAGRQLAQSSLAYTAGMRQSGAPRGVSEKRQRAV